jgi:hypothetical protein
MNKITLIILFLLLFQIENFSQINQQSEELEIFLIDAFCKPDSNEIFILSYYSSFPVKSKVVLQNKYEFQVSNELVELHKIRIDLSKLKFDNKQVEFVIISTDSAGIEYQSEKFDFDLPFEPEIKDGSNLYTLGLFVISVLLVPNPGLSAQNNKFEWSLTKEIPLISFRKGFNYASSFFSFELSYLNNYENNFIYRIGYKSLWEVKSIEFISAGISGFSDFRKKSGIATEMSIGYFKFLETFTIYTRYRYNYIFSSNYGVHEFYVGFYSGFLTIYL